MSESYWLSDSTALPLSHRVPRVDDRPFISGAVFVTGNGLCWRDAPTDYGPHKTVYNSFKTGYFWALARDDRPWGGGTPPGVAFTYASGRGGQHAERILQEFTGILQVDGYAGYNRLIAPDRVGPDIKLAYCWVHARRKLLEITRTGSTPIAEEGVMRISELYRIEAELRGFDADTRLAGRRARAAPVIADTRTWLTHHRVRVAGKSPPREPSDQ